MTEEQFLTIQQQHPRDESYYPDGNGGYVAFSSLPPERRKEIIGQWMRRVETLMNASGIPLRSPDH